MPERWEQVQTAVWLIGLAILAWKNWWWPGILVLVAVSGLTQALISMRVDKATEQAAKRSRAAEEETQRTARRVAAEEALPAKCPNCGSPVVAADVRWTGTTTAACGYCGGPLSAPKEHSSGNG